MNRLTFILALFLLFFAGCESKEETIEIGQNVEYNPMVSAFTSGYISRQSNIVVRFAQATLLSNGVEIDANNILSISPSIKGKAKWVDDRTLTFEPSVPLKSNTKYDVKVDMGAISKSVDAKDFIFNFRTIPLKARIQLDSPQPYNTDDATLNYIKGNIEFSDVFISKQGEPKLNVVQDDKVKEVIWEESSDGRKFSFTIKDINRTELSSIVRASLRADSNEIEEDASAEVEVASINTFQVHSYKVSALPNQVIEVYFSDQLDPTQNLDGLIKINTGIAFESEIFNNSIKIYPRKAVVGDTKITLHQNIINAQGKRLPSTQLIETTLEEAKPAVEFIGNGSILPDSDGLTLPFRAISLNGVQVRVIKIFENNIMAFIRDNNSFSGNYRLRQAGRLILKKTISLDTDKSLDIHKWNTFSIDLEKLISVDPNSLYRVELTFGMQHAVYPGINLSNNEIIVDDEISQGETAYYDQEYGGSQYGGLGGYGYWNERNDPTKKAYYSESRFTSRNIFASNLGIIAKSGYTNQTIVNVTDLRTVESISDADVTLYNMQEQVIAKGSTNKDGFVKIDTDSKPYLLSVKKGNEMGYLLLGDGQALMMSNFNVDGSITQQGLKGFIYGERGVWRPGDNIHLSFILEDSEKSLPEGHPVMLELFNALGQTAAKQIQNIGKQSNSHLFMFSIPTDISASTGNWEARITIGGSTFSKNLKIETVKPNRLKIETKYNQSIIKSKDATVSGTLISRWLHGAPASGLVSKIDGKLYARRTTFNGYKEYNFDNKAISYTSNEFAIVESKLNSNGEVKFSKELTKTNTAPGMLTMQVRTRVFEAGGDFSTAISSIDYSPYQSYLGIKIPEGDKYGVLETDKNHKIELVSLSETGDLTTGNRMVSYKIYKVDWRWWWEKSQENLARYINSYSNNLIKQGDITLSNGKGAIDFIIRQPDWGRYLIVASDKTSKHTTSATVKIDWPGYTSKSSSDASAASMLNIEVEKEEYKVGEVANITFPSSEGGRALISIENGSKVIKQYWTETTKDYTNYSIELEKGMAPNIYAHITMLQPHAQTKNNLPIRMYGVIPIIVNDEQTRLTPLLEMPERLEPKKEVTIKVSEKEGKPMNYTLAIVEDGLLDLTNFVTPKPHNHFYAREALGVKTWDIYNQVIGAYGGRVESIFGIGGSDELQKSLDPSNANRFEPVSIVLGPFKLKSGDSQEHKIMIPNYIGSVRTMVVACQEEMYGSAEKTTQVKSPLMALATLPRMVSIGEEFDLPVTLFTDGSINGKVEISVSTDGPIITKDNNNQSVMVEEGSTMAFYRLSSTDKIGVAKVKVNAKSGKHVSEYEIEIGVRNPNTPISISKYATVEPGKSVKVPFNMIGAKGTDELWIESSTIAPIDFDRRLKYLQSYPHSCVEQTVSAAFPLLFAEQFCDIDKEEKVIIDEKIKSTIAKLARYTTSSGGFAYWPGESNANDWGTSYAGHFLIEAQKRGYISSVNLLDNWVTHQNSLADRWEDSPTNNTVMQTYRLYTLALTGKPNLSAMNRILGSKNLSVDAATLLMSAYSLVGRDDVAQQISTVKREPNQPEYTYTFGSELRSVAIQLMASSHLEVDDNIATESVKYISERLSSSDWLSTQDIAFSMLSLAPWIPSKGENMQVDLQGVEDNKLSISTDRPIYRVKAATLVEKDGEIIFENRGNSTIFARVISHGIPTKPTTNAIAQNLSIKARYLDMQGKEIDIRDIKQGTDFIAVISVTHPGILGKYTNLSLTHLIPSGWEIRNMRMEANSLPNKSDKLRYQDIRDDRILSYFDLEKGETKKIVVLLNAAYKGIFALPSITCSAMYDHSKQAATTATTTTVTGR